VLVIDDNRDARDIFRAVLEYTGALVTTVSSATAALKILRHVRPDVIVSDLSMPGKDGHWFIQQIRGLDSDHGGNIPALAVTAYDGTYMKREVLTSGFQEFLVKPVALRRLCEVIERAVAGHYAARTN